MKGEIKMKKILFVIAFVMMFGFGANAQFDGLFSSWDGGGARPDGGMTEPSMGVPGTEINSNENANAPLGGGMLILTILGAGYAVRKHKGN